jgi:hypothetical protein
MKETKDLMKNDDIVEILNKHERFIIQYEKFLKKVDEKRIQPS